MAEEKVDHSPDDRWPDEFVLRGGRIFDHIYPDAVFRKFPNDPPKRQRWIAQQRKSITLAEWNALSAREKRKFCRHPHRRL